MIKNKLFKLYGIDISAKTEIGEGLHLPHRASIVIGGKVNISKNCSIYQNTAIGGTRIGDVKKSDQPVIGGNVIIFAGSMGLGKINVGDHAIIGSNSVLLSNAEPYGVYVGSPAVRVK